MPSPSDKARLLTDIVDFQVSGALRSRTALDVVRAASTTMLLSQIPGAKRLLNYVTDEAPPHFKFHKRRAGGKHAVIMINGFLSQGSLDVSDWEAAILQKFRRATWYHLDWEATRGLGNRLLHSLTMDGMLDGAYGKKDHGALTAWHASMLAAERAGELLAQAIVCTPDWRYTLVGHSLGARVIHFALKALAGHARKRIENAYLLGGAVGGGAKDDACWATAVGAVKGNIFNCYSGGDGVLRVLYQAANVARSEPIGYSGIHLEHPRIISYDASARVRGHTEWKQHFRSILEHLHEHSPTSPRHAEKRKEASSAAESRSAEASANASGASSTVLAPAAAWPFPTSSRP